MSDSKPDPLYTLTTLDLQVTLTPEERRAYGERLAVANGELAEAIDAKKRAAADHKARIETVEGQIAGLSRAIREGCEMRPVQCTREAIYEQNLVRVARNDTGEVVSERPMEDHERRAIEDQRQPDLPGVETESESRCERCCALAECPDDLADCRRNECELTGLCPSCLVSHHDDDEEEPS